MITALFLSEQKLKDNTVINENVDPKLLTPTIAKVQELRIHEILGTALYLDMQSRLIADPDLSEEANADYLVLLRDWIQPVMIQYCLADVAPDMLVKWLNASLSSKKTTAANSVTFEDMRSISDGYKADAEQYQNRLVRFLIDFAAVKYPLYFNAGFGISYIYPKRESYSSPIFLGNSEKRTFGLEIMVGGPTFPNVCDD